MRIEVFDVGSITAFGGDVDWWQHIGDDLGGQRDVDRQHHTRPERDTECYWQNVCSEELALKLGEMKQARRAAGQE
jgi:hypothetical protein